MEIPLFLKEHDIHILTLNKTLTKSNFKLDIPNYTIKPNDRPRRQGESVAILVHNSINSGMIETSVDYDNETITIILKDSQISTIISTIYIPPVSVISTTLLSNMKTSAYNVTITGDLNAKHTDFNCTERDQWYIAMKRLYMMLIYLNLRTTYLLTAAVYTSDVIDYVTSLRAIYNRIQNLF